MKLSRAIVRLRVPIVILALILMVPSLLGMLNTRVNYDMLTYLPDSMDTVKGQKILLDEFDKGAFSFIILEDMPDKDVADLKAKVEQVDQVASVLWYNNIADISIPKEFLPDKVYNAFNTDHSTVMAVFFNTSTSSDETMDAIREIRSITGEKCFVAGMTAMVIDLRDLCEREEPIYVGIAVALASLAMIVFLDGWLVPFVFLASIGTAGAPGAGMIMLAMVLESVGLPVEGIALIAGVDKLFDMGRTCLNVTGDISCSLCVTQWEQNKDAKIKA